MSQSSRPGVTASGDAVVASSASGREASNTPSGSKRVDNPTDFAEEYVQRIEHEGHQALRRALLERYRVNVGLIAENTELKRKLRQPDVREVRLRFTDPGTIADLDGA